MPYTEVCLNCHLVYRYGGVQYCCKAYGGKKDEISHLVCTKCGTEHLVHHYRTDQGEDRGYVLLAKEGPSFQQLTPEQLEPNKADKDSFWMEWIYKHPPVTTENGKHTGLPDWVGFSILIFELIYRVVYDTLRKAYLKVTNPLWAKREARGRKAPVPEFDEPWVNVEQGQGNSGPDYDQYRCNYCGEQDSLASDLLGTPCPHCGSDESLRMDYYDRIYCGGRRYRDSLL